MNTWLEPEISYGVAWAGMIPFLIIDTGLALPRALFTLPSGCLHVLYVFNQSCFLFKGKGIVSAFIYLPHSI